MELKQARALISGLVQGVWYRASTQDKARELGLSGWVRNLPSGQVEALFQGPEETVQQALDWCWQGPQASRVSRVEVDWGPPDPGLDSFEVRY